MGVVVIPIPLQDSDPSEVAITWKILSDEGHKVVFATQDGTPGKSDELMLTGEGLDFWSGIPILNRLAAVGLVLKANKDARKAYQAMITRPEFLTPIKWEDINVSSFDALFLPGGHRARGMREYLESPILQAKVVEFFDEKKPVGAICHGVILAARSKSPETGKSALFGRKTTSLTWSLENAAWGIAKWTRFWDPNYYRTYLEEEGQPPGYMSVQQEVTRELEKPEDDLDVEKDDTNYRKKTGGLARDSLNDDSPAFICRDGNYISARWPGDVHTLAKAFVSMVREQGMN
jgi:putative intracellular protease/amidase